MQVYGADTRRGKIVRTTVPDHAAPWPLDRVNRHVKADRPNQLWISDFTYVSTWQGWLYVAFVIDVYARCIASCRVIRSMHRHGPWKTQEAVELATLEWVAWFNHIRLLEPLGYIPPAAAEANYNRQLAEQAKSPACT